MQLNSLLYMACLPSALSSVVHALQIKRHRLGRTGAQCIYAAPSSTPSALVAQCLLLLPHQLPYIWLNLRELNPRRCMPRCAAQGGGQAACLGDSASLSVPQDLLM